MNNVSLLGRTTSEIELKTTASGKSVVSFTLAVNRKYDKQKTDFIPCVAWNKTAEFLSQYVRKGQMIAIEGEIQVRSYTDREGKNRNAFEVIASNVYFAGDKPKETTNIVPNISNNDFEEIGGMSDSDLPF